MGICTIIFATRNCDTVILANLGNSAAITIIVEQGLGVAIRTVVSGFFVVVWDCLL